MGFQSRITSQRSKVMGFCVATCKCGHYFLVFLDDLDIKKAIKCSKCGGMIYTRDLLKSG
jgi:hypothetical protein